MLVAQVFIFMFIVVCIDTVIEIAFPKIGIIFNTVDDKIINFTLFVMKRMDIDTNEYEED